MESEAGAKILRSLAIVTHCVERLDAAESAWSGVPGYRTVERGELTADLCAAWNTPAAQGQRYCLMQPASGEEVYLRFIETGERGHGPPATRGWSATELLVTDTDDLAGRLEGSGFRRLGGPGNLYPRDERTAGDAGDRPLGRAHLFHAPAPGRQPLRAQAGALVRGPAVHRHGRWALRRRDARRFTAACSACGSWTARRSSTPFSPSSMACRRTPSSRPRWRASRAGGSCWRWTNARTACRRAQRRAGHLPPGLAMVSFVVRDLDELDRLQPQPVPTRAPPRAIKGIALWRTPRRRHRRPRRRVA